MHRRALCSRHGGGLLLRIRGNSSSCVFRFTVPSGRRREMGLGVARLESPAHIADGLTAARQQAYEARELLQQDVDPIEARDERRKAAEQAKKAAKAKERWTLARAARDYHERVIEPSRTAKHAAQWIASLEHHVSAEIWHKPRGEIEPPELLAALGEVRSLEDKTKRIPETLRRVRPAPGCGVRGRDLPQALHVQPRGRPDSEEAGRAVRGASFHGPVTAARAARAGKPASSFGKIENCVRATGAVTPPHRPTLPPLFGPTRRKARSSAVSRRPPQRRQSS